MHHEIASKTILPGGGVGVVSVVVGGGVVCSIIVIVSLIHCKYSATFVKTPGYLIRHLVSVHKNNPTTVAFPLMSSIKLPEMKLGYFNSYIYFHLYQSCTLTLHFCKCKKHL